MSETALDIVVGFAHYHKIKEAGDAEAELAALRSENESLEKDAFDLGAYANGLAEKLEPMMNEAETASMRMCMELLDGMDESVYPEAYGYIALKMEEEHKKHTERVIITCPETCYCWEVEAFLIGREKAAAELKAEAK